MSRLPPAPNVRGLGTGNAALPSTAMRPPSPPRSDSGSSSGSSHTSHSSHIERERERNLGEAADQRPSVAKPIAAAIAVLLYLFIAQAVGLWLFTGGFLLTRTTLEDVSSCASPSAQLWTPPKPAFPKSTMGEDQLSTWETTLLTQAECTLPATYKQTVLWIIDALRYDFIADANVPSNGSWSPNPHYHNVFQAPARLHYKSGKSFSFLSHFLADAPTTTLQRLKGLTTGSLPTFIDAGSNFGGSVITEDNWLAQLQRKHAKDNTSGMAFVGDDTWVTVFPSIFDEAWTWPFDSFNVEDLDGVDRGVEAKLDEFLQPVLSSTLTEWRLLVAHMLGVDHVGHRLGASHPRMKVKLQEMEAYMDRLLDSLPDDALLVLMGDHGMDERGDHGGDGELQVGAGLWMYSKAAQRGGGIKPEIIDEIVAESSQFVAPHLFFSPLPSPPFAQKGHRSVPQIDFVPTISLLLGLPIPFNNLGSVIPEAFGTVDLLLRALRINAIQIHSYLQRYSTASRDLQPFQAEIRAAWRQAIQKDADFVLASSSQRQQAMKEVCSAYMAFNRIALVRAKEIWAKFDMAKMVAGLSLLGLSLVTCFKVRAQAEKASDAVEVVIELYRKSRYGVMAGMLVAIIVKTISKYTPTMLPVMSLSLLESVGLGAALGGQASYLASTSSLGPSVSASPSVATSLGLALPLFHSIAFSSNSFTVNEDCIVVALAVGTMCFRGLQGYLNAPTTRLKLRIPAFATLAVVCLRMASAIKVCREEQGPECPSTFYVANDDSLNSIWAIGVAYLCALVIPTLVSRALNMSRAFAGVAPLFLNWMLRPALLMAAGYWLVDWAFTAEAVSLQEGTSAYHALKWAKLALARVDMALIAIVGLSFWIFSPLCLELSRENIDAKTLPVTPQSSLQAPTQRIVVLGFANSFGSSYLLLLTLVFSLQFLIAQPGGQIALTLISAALFACAEIGDGERDSSLLNNRLAQGNNDKTSPPMTTLPVSFLETSTLALIGFVAFFSTGHQATFDSIQWRTAFVGFDTVSYLFSPILVSLNSFAPLVLLPSMGVAFLVLYNLAPRPRAAPNTSESTVKMPVVKHILQASLSFLIYHLIVTLSTAIFAAHFKRHLMLFKIWTPRFMLGAVSLQLTFLSLILGLLAAGNIASKVSLTFGSHF